MLVGYEMLHRVIMRAIMVNEKSPYHKLGCNANAVTRRQVNLVRRMCPKALASATPPYFPTPGPGQMASMATWCRTKGYLCIYSVLSVWSLHVHPVPSWTLSGCSGSLLQSKD